MLTPAVCGHVDTGPPSTQAFRRFPPLVFLPFCNQLDVPRQFRGFELQNVVFRGFFAVRPRVTQLAATWCNRCATILQPFCNILQPALVAKRSRRVPQLLADPPLRQSHAQLQNPRSAHPAESSSPVSPCRRTSPLTRTARPTQPLTAHQTPKGPRPRSSAATGSSDASSD